MMNTTDPLALDYLPELPNPSPGWRREPPTVDDVHRWSWWWHRVSGSGEEPTILKLDVMLDSERTILKLDGWPTAGLPCVVFSGHHRWIPLRPEDWGGPEAEWATAVPPGTIL